MLDIKNIADKADMIVNGYAFTRKNDGIHVLNLNSPGRAVVFSEDGNVLETSMDDFRLYKRSLSRDVHSLEAI